MRSKNLRPMSFTAVPAYVPRSRRIRYTVEADLPVSTFLMDRCDFDRYDRGEEVRTFGGSRQRRYHKQRGKMPYSGDWMLVISNENEHPVTVHFDVY